MYVVQCSAMQCYAILFLSCCAVQYYLRIPMYRARGAGSGIGLGALGGCDQESLEFACFLNERLHNFIEVVKRSPDHGHAKIGIAACS